MGQVLSYIISHICGQAEQKLLTSAPWSDSCSDSSTSGALHQTPLTFPPTSDSCSDSVTSGALQQTVLTFPPTSDSCSAPRASGAILQQNLLNSSPWSDSCSNSGKWGALMQQNPQTYPPSLNSPANPRTNGALHQLVVVNLNIQVVDKGKGFSHLPDLNTIELLREERGEQKLSERVLIKERRIQHYSSCYKILLVGDGDFSFSASLGKAFGSATNMVATSLNSKEFLSKNYKNAMSNIDQLKSRGCKVMHGVDATEMANHRLLKGMTFDRIVFNFPHAGFSSNESRKSQLRRHRTLVCQFLANAKKMITEKGEIHISHKSNGFFREWNLELLGSNVGLQLIEDVPFDFTDYPGYHTKYGYGGDGNFNCNPSKTYKFGF